jgi:hypothetical protein
MSKPTHVLKSNAAKNLVAGTLKRLRSTSSKKFKGALKSPRSSSYCPLGHFCIVAGKSFHSDVDENGRDVSHCEGEVTALPNSVMELLDSPECYEDNLPVIKVAGEVLPISSFNDGYEDVGLTIAPFSLAEIADAIEADWVLGGPLAHHDKVIRTTPAL